MKANWLCQKHLNELDGEKEILTIPNIGNKPCAVCGEPGVYLVRDRSSLAAQDGLVFAGGPGATQEKSCRMNQMKTDFEFIRFEKIRDTGKTTVWDCIHKDDSFNLGQVKWFGSWRQYTFFPTNDTVFSSGCLGDIRLFIDELMQERKLARLVSAGGPGARQEPIP